MGPALSRAHPACHIYLKRGHYSLCDKHISHTKHNEGITVGGLEIKVNWMEFSRGVCSCVLEAQCFIVYEHVSKPHSLRSLSGFSPGVLSYPKPHPGNVSQGRALQSLAWQKSVEAQSLAKSRDFHTRAEQRARTALPERNRQKSKHRFQAFMRKNCILKYVSVSAFA